MKCSFTKNESCTEAQTQCKSEDASCNKMQSDCSKSACYSKCCPFQSCITSIKCCPTMNKCPIFSKIICFFLTILGFISCIGKFAIKSILLCFKLVLGIALISVIVSGLFKMTSGCCKKCVVVSEDGYLAMKGKCVSRLSESFKNDLIKANNSNCSVVLKPNKLVVKGKCAASFKEKSLVEYFNYNNQEIDEIITQSESKTYHLKDGKLHEKSVVKSSAKK